MACTLDDGSGMQVKTSTPAAINCKKRPPEMPVMHYETTHAPVLHQAAPPISPSRLPAILTLTLDTCSHHAHLLSKLLCSVSQAAQTRGRAVSTFLWLQAPPVRFTSAFNASRLSTSAGLPKVGSTAGKQLAHLPIKWVDIMSNELSHRQGVIIAA